jgi:hypothetical protein
LAYEEVNNRFNIQREGVGIYKCMRLCSLQKTAVPEEKRKLKYFSAGAGQGAGNGDQ